MEKEKLNCIAFLKEEDHYVVITETEAKTLGMYRRFDSEQEARIHCRAMNEKYFVTHMHI